MDKKLNFIQSCLDMGKNMQFDADADIYKDKNEDKILIRCKSMDLYNNKVHINISRHNISQKCLKMIFKCLI